MNLRILASLVVIGVMSAGVGYGTYAFFNDTETSANNLFAAGTMDLTLNGAGSTTATIGGSNFAPGDTVTGSLVLRNEGSIYTGDAQGHAVDVDFKINATVTDAPASPSDPGQGGPSPVPLDRYLVLTTLKYGGQSILGNVGDRDGDGRANTLRDIALAGVFRDLPDPGSAGKTLEMAVQFSPDGGNDLQGDSVNLSFTFYLSQAADADLA